MSISECAFKIVNPKYTLPNANKCDETWFKTVYKCKYLVLEDGRKKGYDCHNCKQKGHKYEACPYRWYILYTHRFHFSLLHFLLLKKVFDFLSSIGIINVCLKIYILSSIAKWFTGLHRSIKTSPCPYATTVSGYSILCKKYLLEAATKLLF